MKNVINVPADEYEKMKEQLSLLKDNDLIKKMNRLIDLLYEEKYGLYLGNDVSDLTNDSIKNNWTDQNSKWDNV